MASGGAASPADAGSRAAAAAWADAHLGGRAEPPFSFALGGRPSTDLLAQWPVAAGRPERRGPLLRRSLTYRQPGAGLQVRCAAVQYPEFGIVEWTIHLRNAGAEAGPILSDLQALDVRLRHGPESELALHHHAGSTATPHDYEPRRTALPLGAELRLAASGGRSSNHDLPYFNLETPEGGVIIAVGWPGQWAARFIRERSGDLSVRAGMERTHLRLLPGEEIRLPRIVLQFWRGQRQRAHNTFRRFMLERNPLPGAAPPPPLLAPCSSHQFGEMVGADEASQRQFVDRYLQEGLVPDCWWMDAGWYPCGGDWTRTGTWEVDGARFPSGLRAVSDHAHARGVATLLWFEPERVAPGTWLDQRHPEWLLGAAGGHRLLDLGNPRARSWLTGHVSGLLEAQGIDLYRHDCNLDPLDLWRASDAADRQGIREIGHCTGLLAYWDGLRRRRPGLRIDNCASGGRRNDVECLRRAVPLLRSDHLFEPLGQQCHTYGLSFWVPFHGTGTRAADAYGFRSTMCSALIPCWDVRRPDLDYAALRRLVGQWREVAPCFSGDYYPLTPYARGEEAWIAWQFHRLDLELGVVQAFRRPRAEAPALTVRLCGLEPGARYALTDLDTGLRQVQTGAALAAGLELALPERPGSALLVYRRLGEG